MTLTWPCVITEDRYGGAYSGGAWVAVTPAVGERLKDVEDIVQGSDLMACRFPDMVHVWASVGTMVAVGDTPDKALNALADVLVARDKARTR